MKIENLLGVHIEYPNTNLVSLTAIILASRIYTKLGRITIEGHLPKIGPAILVANHTSSTDILKMCYASVATSQRIIRGVARKSLLDPKYKEPQEVLERTESLDRFDPMKLPLVAPTIAFVLNGIGAVPIRRGEIDIAFFRNCDFILNSGQLLGLFAQETRVKEGDLRNIMPGIGFLARRHAEVPIIPIGISKRLIRIGQSFTYLNLEQELGRRLDTRETTAAVVDKIAQLLSQDIRYRWELTDRPLFLSKN